MYEKGVASLGGRGDWVPQKWATWTEHLCAGGYWDSARLTFQANDAEVSTLGQARSYETGALSTCPGDLSHSGLRLGRRKPGGEMQPGVLASLLSWCAHHT